MYTNTRTQIHVHKCKYTDTRTQIHVHKLIYSDTHTFGSFCLLNISVYFVYINFCIFHHTNFCERRGHKAGVECLAYDGSTTLLSGSERGRDIENKKNEQVLYYLRSIARK